jgi:hypothetical protein
VVMYGWLHTWQPSPTTMTKKNQFNGEAAQCMTRWLLQCEQVDRVSGLTITRGAGLPRTQINVRHGPISVAHM